VSSKETTFLGTDLPVPQASWKAVFNHVSTSRPDWLAVCGSIPGWKSAWANDIKVLLESKANTRICADTYGPPLESLVKLPIDLVKINRQELEKLAPAEQGKPTLEVLKTLLSEKPVRNWSSTDGAQPLIAAFEDGSMYEVTPASIGEISPTGSGDTFLAAVLQKWDSNNHEETLNHAGACATANAASERIGDFPLPVPERYLPTIRQL
jgi:fructose-1-phosphate kinase PfkB-like protein